MDTNEFIKTIRFGIGNYEYLKAILDLTSDCEKKPPSVADIGDYIYNRWKDSPKISSILRKVHRTVRMLTSKGFVKRTEESMAFLA